MNKLSVYWNTVKHLKPEQIVCRITRKLKLNCSLGITANTEAVCTSFVLLPWLDFDSCFLNRFPVEELLQDRITLLHETEEFSWDSVWHFKNRSPLWNYNLHYCEYLFSLVEAWRETKQACCLEKFMHIVDGWITQNPKQAGGVGWDAYPISLRLIVWMNCYSYLENDLEEVFKGKMLASMAEQYTHLATHLEKHLLGNHYFENLKTLVICGLFFHDEKMTNAALRELKKQCVEQILSDGMHFELSPMYHKIILEDLLRVCAALRQAGRQDEELEAYLQPMVDVAYSLEEGLERIPLFNDCGNNVTKSLDALLTTAKREFGIDPIYKSQFPDSGYYIFKNGDWKLIVDAGQPGPSYLPGHAHCDAMSFELFCKGKPVLANCGTYAYQCAERGFFRSTAAHNTVMVEGTEQSQCWGNFRMGKRSHTSVLEVTDHHISMEIADQLNNRITRHITFCENRMDIEDLSDTLPTVSHLHFQRMRREGNVLCIDDLLYCTIPSDTKVEYNTVPYAEEFGKKEMSGMIQIKGNYSLHITWKP